MEDRIIQRIDYLIEKGKNILYYVHESLYFEDYYIAWKTQCHVFMINFLGNDHIYPDTFSAKVSSGEEGIALGLAILRALREDVSDKFVSDIRTLVSAEVFTDFLGMAEHLIEAGYKDPAASLVGAVLEDGLRRIASNHDITVKSKDDLGSLNQRCAQAGVYNQLQRQRVQTWNVIRNDADHGHFGNYTEQDVKEMLAGVKDFLARFLV